MSKGPGDFKKSWNGFAAQTPQNTPSSDVHLSKAALEKARQTLQSQLEDKSAHDEVSGLLRNNPAMLSMIEGRLSSLVGKSSGYIESLAPAVQNRITALKGLQKDCDAIQYEFRQKMLDLETKYEKKYQPIFSRRAEIIKGVSEPVDDELDHEEEIFQNNLPDPKGIPEFWLTCLHNVFLVGEMITPQDENVLRSLSDIRFTNLSGDVHGYKLEFEFDPNDYFTNKILTKTYYYKDDLSPSGEFLYDHAEGDKINWIKPEKNLTVRVETKKQRNRKTNQTRLVRTTVPNDSFFNFFSPPQLDDDESDDGLDDKTELLELDYQLGEVFKDQIIPLAIDCFLEEGDLSDFNQMDEEDSEDAYTDEEDLSSDDEEILSSEISD